VNNASAYLNPVSPRIKDVFYSSIPVQWDDLEEEKITDLPCCRDSFEPPSAQAILVDGRVVK